MLQHEGLRSFCCLICSMFRVDGVFDMQSVHVWCSDLGRALLHGLFDSTR